MLKTKKRDKIITFQSCSKTYAMTGWRIGYGAGNSTLINAMKTIQSQSTSSACSVSQEAAREALRRAAHKLSVPTQIVARSEEF